ncbi:hypothetical protein [Streptomyces sp. NPDC086519]|uniref:hypothetical protein n=1 Tax=Streptomyces sp. NPDC086519 TaxID=3154863 RepID=UPI0034267A8A
MKKIVCPHCSQDWIHKYRRKDIDSVFFMCPECESLWLHEEDLEDETDMYLSEYMAQYDAVTVWSVIEKVD